MGLSVENLCGLLIRSRLHTPEGVKACYQRWQASAQDRASVKAFTRWLIENKYVTEYQATLLANGYADNFFLGSYKILDRIGKGRMAGVYKAVHPSGQMVAIKVLPPSKASDPPTLARFQREAQLATQLVHHCVVRTFHHGESNGLHYLVMEHLEGDTLEALLKQRGKLPPREAVRIAFLVCLGLQHIHEKGMVHRDMKPGNIMLCPFPGPQDSTLKSLVKILDIGLGKNLFDPKSKEARSDLTGEGAIIGTPDYLAPEQARDARTVDIRADLYSLGCVLYHMLAGQPPFVEQNPVRLVLRHATETPKPITDLKADAPEELNRILTCFLAKDPNQRFESPLKAAEALKGFLGADAEAARAKAESRELQNYLESLKQSASAPAGETTISEPVAVQFPVPAQTAARTAKPPPSRAALVKKRREKLTRSAPQASPKSTTPRARAVAEARGSEPPIINVEIVDLGQLRASPLGLPIPRDLFMLLAGAIGGAVAVLGVVSAVWILALLLTSGSAR